MITCYSDYGLDLERAQDRPRPTLEQVDVQLARHLAAGFTWLALDIPGVPPEEIRRAYQRASRNKVRE